jgi:NADH-quinone oxidoreductase subunit M
LVTTVLTALIAGWVVFHYEPVKVGGAFPSLTLPWISASSDINIQFAIGLDGLSVWLFGLSALLCITAVLVSWEVIGERPAAFYSLLLLLESGMLGVFAARDIILFYIFFEFTLIPLFFLIGVWGSEDRRYAALKFFIYTLSGSLLTFLGLLAIVLWDYNHPFSGLGGGGGLNFSIPELTEHLRANPIPYKLQMLIFIALFAGFAIKVPLFPLHTWLPLAHVQAPTAGSVILAGVLLKIGTYGFVRFSMPMLPDATALCAPWLLWLAVAGIIYGAFVALAQTDLKRLIAYSSVSHLGYCMLGLFALNKLGMDGSVLQMINHGISTGGLFAIVGMIYERYHTREIAKLGGLTKRTPLLAFFLLLFTMSSIGLPGLNGFAGEFLILNGMFQRAWTGAPAGHTAEYLTIAALAVFGVVLGAWYMLWLVERTFFGPLKEPVHGDEHHPIHDMNVREVFALAPLVVFMFWIGLHPKFFVDKMQSTIDPIAVDAGEAFEKLLPPVAVAEGRNDESATGKTELASSAVVPHLRPSHVLPLQISAPPPVRSAAGD